MTVTILLGLFLFLGFLFLFLFMLPRPSAESALLEEVTREARRPEGETNRSQSWRVLSADLLGKPFALLRRFITAEPDPELVRRLMLAGYRKPSHPDIFLGTRLALPAVLGFSVALLVPENTILFFLLAVALAFFLPDFWLSHAINKRRERIKLSLPDALDMLAICMEAGLGLDQGIVRIGHELRVSHRELSEELLQINFEQRAGVPRIESWRAFAARIKVESLTQFVAMLVQTERFGTPLGAALTSFSDSLRTDRRQKAEELGAKAAIKLIFPMVLFIFPTVFIVLIGPAIVGLLRHVVTLLD